MAKCFLEEKTKLRNMYSALLKLEVRHTTQDWYSQKGLPRFRLKFNTFV